MLEELGETLKATRLLRGLSLAQTAERAQTSTAYVQKLERGEVSSPSPHRLRNLAAALDVPYSDLMRLAGYADEEELSAGLTTQVEVLAQALQSEDLTPEEIQELGEYLRFRRGQRS